MMKRFDLLIIVQGYWFAVFCVYASHFGKEKRLTIYGFFPPLF